MPWLLFKKYILLVVFFVVGRTTYHVSEDTNYTDTHLKGLVYRSFDIAYNNEKLEGLRSPSPR